MTEARIACVIAGCGRSKPASGVVGEEWICGKHWSAGVPPRSAQRAVYRRFKRIVRRFGWNEERYARQDRLWAWLKARCVSAAAGDIDQREIDRLFGWDA